MLVAFLPIFVLPYARAGDQVTSGTIVVIAQTKQRVIIAADSGAGTTPDGTMLTSTNDCDCKIAALSSHVVFTSSGVVSNGNASWTTISEAVSAGKDIPSNGISSSSQGALVMKIWAQSMIQRLSGFTPSQLLSVALANDGHITTGILAGVDTGGNVWVQAVTISFMINFSNLVGLSFEPYTLTPAGAQTGYYFLGKAEVALEFYQDTKSPRAIAERASWSRKKMSGATFDRFKARRLVELTIMYHSPTADVGGSIDEVQLDSRGVHWIKIKRNCKKQEQ
jgi:hypothetical protein